MAKTSVTLPYYIDPDQEDVYQLVQAAYHLQLGGMYDLSGQVVEAVCRIFGPMEINIKKGKPLCKRLNNVEYYPSGLLRLPLSGMCIELAAPPYKIQQDNETDSAAQHKILQDRIRWLSSQGSIGWFPTRQLMAQLTGRLPNPGGFQPARILKSVQALCDKFDPDASPETNELLAAKLWKLTEKSSAKWAQKAAVEENGWGARSERVPFRWLDEEQMKTILDILRSPGFPNFHANQLLWDVKPHCITWRQPNWRPLSHDAIMGEIETDPESTKIYNASGTDRSKYTNSSKYAISRHIETIMDRAKSINALQCAHMVLCRDGIGTDKQLAGLLPAIEIADPGFQPEDSLWKQAAELLLYLKNPDGKARGLPCYDGIHPAIRKAAANAIKKMPDVPAQN